MDPAGRGKGGKRDVFAPKFYQTPPVRPLLQTDIGTTRAPEGCPTRSGALALGSSLVNNYANGIGKWLAARPMQPCVCHREGHNLKHIMKIFERVLNPREIRRRLGLNQEQFWTQIGVTQSGGSRYESGREMPKPVRELLRLVHVEQVDLSQVKRVDFEIINYLKESHPDLYRNLRRAARSRHKRSDGHSVPAAGETTAERQAETVDDRD